MTDPAAKIEHDLSVVEVSPGRKVWTLANGLSVGRILLLPFILYLFSRDDSLTLTTLLMIVAALTDVFDGYFARRYGEISKMGMILDPVADKMMIGAISAFLVSLKGFPLWLVMTVILRDVIILIGGTVLLRAKGSPLASNVAGKLTTISLALTIFFFVINADSWLKQTCVWLSTGLLIVSSSLYCTMFFRSMRHRSGSIVWAVKKDVHHGDSSRCGRRTANGEGQAAPSL
ncbi:MAG: CDP-alcohol phosphatidyltransferase family protein [Candidatus Latescibacteria bacterium]|nr:CDP-alcohol phosphatidyltransferase family protein [Candidatus Latescibacterota bacterium]